MQGVDEKPVEWRASYLAGWSRTLRLTIDAAFAGLVCAILVWGNSGLFYSPLGMIVCTALIVVAVYNPVSRFHSGVCWSAEGIRRKTLLGHGRLLNWSKLTKIDNNMFKRATVLSFGPLWRLNVYWGYDAHREIADYAERKLTENARTS